MFRFLNEYIWQIERRVLFLGVMEKSLKKGWFSLGNFGNLDSDFFFNEQNQNTGVPSLSNKNIDNTNKNFFEIFIAFAFRKVANNLFLSCCVATIHY